MSTNKFGTYTSREEFLENEVRTLNHYITNMIDTMKVMSMERQDMSNEIDRLKQELKSVGLTEHEKCVKSILEIMSNSDDGEWASLTREQLVAAIRARGEGK